MAESSGPHSEIEAMDDADLAMLIIDQLRDEKAHGDDEGDSCGFCRAVEALNELRHRIPTGVTSGPHEHAGRHERLRAWLDDMVLGRYERPQYANPGELKADIRAALAELEQARAEAVDLVALTLAAYGDTSSRLGDAIPQEVWDRLTASGSLRHSRDFTGEGVCDTTPDARDYLVERVAALAGSAATGDEPE